MGVGAGTYEIKEGVRRAKAFALFGLTTIQSVIQYPDGRHSPVFQVPIGSLRSPKLAIDMSSNAKAERFWRIWRALQAGLANTVQPITIAPGARGTRIEDIGWIL